MELDGAIAEAFHLSPSHIPQIFAIPGADDGIFRWLLFCRSLGARTFKTIHSVTYDHALVFARQLQYQLALSDELADTIYICTPNNPCGSTTSPRELVEFARGFHGHILVDLSYASFGTHAIDEYLINAIEGDVKNCSFVVSGAKMFPLAGLRFGWLFSLDPEICELARSQLNPKLLAPIARNVAKSCLTEARFYFAQNRVIFENRDSTAKLLADFISANGVNLRADLEGGGNFFRLYGNTLALQQASRILFTRGVVIRKKAHWPFLRVTSLGPYLLQILEARLSTRGEV
jgi:histidinol-phosphate/aromatic aminotransferase/cobyric acid decarboxylase-like protein